MDKLIDKKLEQNVEEDICDLDSNKICDNCGKCLEVDADYKVIQIEKIILKD